MAKIFPFRALLPEPAAAGRVATPPYDVVDADDVRRLVAGNPQSFLRVTRSEVELPPETDPYAPAVYELAARNLARLRQEGALRADAEARLYLYALTMGTHRQVGLVAACAVDDYDDDTIKKHERTRQAKEDDRTRHILATRCHSGPVFLTYRDRARVNELAAQAMTAAPFLDFDAGDGVRHQLWCLDTATTQALVREFAALECLYIADGHHRAKSASRVRELCRAANPGHTGQEAYNRFLAVIFPASQVRILPYNRVLRDLNGLTPAALLARVDQVFLRQPAAQAAPAGTGTIHLYLEGRWWALQARPGLAPASGIESLDVSVLQARLLAPVLGIDDPRTSDRIEFIGGIHGTARLEQLVQSGRAALACAMYPVTVAQLMAISDAGEVMPPKSTWFEPKLRDGVAVHVF